jgi:hypothetical protein
MICAIEYVWPIVLSILLSDTRDATYTCLLPMRKDKPSTIQTQVMQYCLRHNIPNGQ